MSSDVPVVTNRKVIDLIDIYAALKKYRLMIFLFFAVSLILSTAYALNLDNRYLAKSVLLSEGADRSAQNSLGGLAQLAGFTNQGNNELDKYIAIFKSRAFFSVLKQAITTSEGGTEFEFSSISYESFLSDFRLTPERDSNLVNIAVWSHSPSDAAALANLSVVILNGYLRAKETDRIDRALAFLKRQLGQTELVEMKNMLYGLIATQVKEKMFIDSKEEFVFSVIDKAIPPTSHEKPNRAIIVTVGGLLGLLLSSLVAVTIGVRWTD